MGVLCSFHASDRCARSRICAEIENCLAQEPGCKLMTLRIPMPVLPEVQTLPMRLRIPERTSEIDEWNSSGAKNPRERKVGPGERVTAHSTVQLHIVRYEHCEQLRVKLRSIALEIGDRGRSRVGFFSREGRGREHQRLSFGAAMPIR